MKCSYCEKSITPKFNATKAYRRRFCGMEHYHLFRKESRPKEEHERWEGGVSSTEAHRRWKLKNPSRMAYLKAARYARERGATGNHSFEEWEALKSKHHHLCVGCGEQKPLTRDHIIPLALGGSHDITNIQPLCRNCNSRKWMKVLTPDLLK
jgi:5-methylcytosine-specific restriction endonuclease McrA